MPFSYRIARFFSFRLQVNRSCSTSVGFNCPALSDREVKSSSLKVTSRRTKCWKIFSQTACILLPECYIQQNRISLPSYQTLFILNPEREHKQHIQTPSNYSNSAFFYTITHMESCSLSRLLWLFGFRDKWLWQSLLPSICLANLHELALNVLISIRVQFNLSATPFCWGE